MPGRAPGRGENLVMKDASTIVRLPAPELLSGEILVPRLPDALRRTSKPSVRVIVSTASSAR
jgi:hypothetical protein